jgi:hypothetical protein
VVRNSAPLNGFRTTQRVPVPGAGFTVVAMDVILIAGLWLDGSAWTEVASELERLGHRPIPVTLPGQGAGSPAATLDDQVAAVARPSTR